jgi:hypothetical protein
MMKFPGLDHPGSIDGHLDKLPAMLEIQPD